MDELEEIRGLLPEQAPPSAHVMAQARARLARTERRSVRPRLAVPLAVVTVAAAATVVAVSLPSADHVGDRGQASELVAPASARDIMLAAAVRAESDAAAHGRFWHVRTVTGAVLQRGPLGTPPHTYTLEQRVVTENWLSATGSEPDWTAQRDIGTRPLTPADEAAWRADGAPDSWNLGFEPEIGRDLVLSTKPAAGTLSERSPLAQVVPGMTTRQLKDLPADAAALRTLLAQNRTAGRPEPSAPTPEVVDSYVFNRAVQLLADSPAPPAMRAAALRLIAELDGVRRAGPATDPLGRTGTGITLATGADATELVIDPATGTLLGCRYTGSEAGKVVKRSSVAVLATGWTDADPAIPSADVN